MLIEQFNAGHYEPINGYKYFVPTTINKEWTWETPIINRLLERASLKLGELNSFSKPEFKQTMQQCRIHC